MEAVQPTQKAHIWPSAAMTCWLWHGLYYVHSQQSQQLLLTSTSKAGNWWRQLPRSSAPAAWHNSQVDMLAHDIVWCRTLIISSAHFQCCNQHWRSLQVTIHVPYWKRRAGARLVHLRQVAIRCRDAKHMLDHYFSGDVATQSLLCAANPCFLVTHCSNTGLARAWCSLWWYLFLTRLDQQRKLMCARTLACKPFCLEPNPPKPWVSGPGLISCAHCCAAYVSPALPLGNPWHPLPLTT